MHPFRFIKRQAGVFPPANQNVHADFKQQWFMSPAAVPALCGGRDIYNLSCPGLPVHYQPYPLQSTPGQVLQGTYLSGLNQLCHW